MRVFWVYEISSPSAGGAAINRTDLHCASEEEAKEQAKALAVQSTIELGKGRDT